jgi:hypothetical protein
MALPEKPGVASEQSVLEKIGSVINRTPLKSLIDHSEGM